MDREEAHLHGAHEAAEQARREPARLRVLYPMGTWANSEWCLY